MINPNWQPPTAPSSAWAPPPPPPPPPPGGGWSNKKIAVLCAGVAVVVFIAANGNSDKPSSDGARSASTNYTIAKTSCYQTALADPAGVRAAGKSPLAAEFARNAAAEGANYSDLYNGCYAGISAAVD